MQFAPKFVLVFVMAFAALTGTALAAPAQLPPMVVNYGLAGSWFEPETSGQGVIFDIVPSVNQMAAYWFTYPESGAETKMVLYVDDRGPELLFTHGIQDSPPDEDGFPTQLPELFFQRE